MEMEMAMDRGRITLLPLLLLLFLSAARTCLAQQSNGTRDQPSAAGGGFTPTTAVVLVVLIFAFVVLTLFSIYINRCAQARAPPHRGFRAAPETVINVSYAHSDRRRAVGLDRELVEAFPTAVYADVKAHMAAKSGPLECAVCLCEFADSDELRVLPACYHVFHPGCIDPWLAGAITCPLCRADLTGAPALPAADSCDLTAPEEAVQEEPDLSEELDVACLAGSFTPESAISFGASHDILGAGGCYYSYRRTQSAMEAPDRHTLWLPDHVMKELAAVRRHRRAASLAGYPDAAERTPRWLSSLWWSVSWQRHNRGDSDAGEEHGGSKRVFPVAGAAGERPSGSGSRGDVKEKPDADALNRV